MFIGRLYCHIAVGNSQAWIFILGVLGGQLIFFGPGIFWVLLKTLGILRGLDFCLSFDHPGCLQYTPPGAISNTLCSVSFNSRKTGANVKKFDCALFL